MERQSCEEKLGKMDLFPLKKSQGRHHSISVFEAWLQKAKTNRGFPRATGTSCSGRMFYSKNNHSLEQLPQGNEGVPITEDFKNGTGQGAK